MQVHVDKVRENSQNFETTHKSGKLMHRFTEQQLEKLMDDEIMKEPDSYGHLFHVANQPPSRSSILRRSTLRKPGTVEGHLACGAVT